MSIFVQEHDEGNIEYKCYFNLLKKDRLEQYTTQLNYRINEGDGIAIYLIGIKDNGAFYGLTESILDKNTDILSHMASKIDCKLTLILKSSVNFCDKHFAICKVKSNYQPNILF